MSGSDRVILVVILVVRLLVAVLVRMFLQVLSLGRANYLIYLEIEMREKVSTD